MTDLTRRSFMRLAAVAPPMAAVYGKQFTDKLVSSALPNPKNLSRVDWIVYATTCRECPAGCGMHARHHTGRTTKVEGNPQHPINQGGLCARGQSSVQGLYDPDRIGRPLLRKGEGTGPLVSGFEPSGWKQALEAIGGRLKNEGGRPIIVSGLETGLLPGIMRRFAEAFGGDFLLFEPYHYRPIIEANKALFGRPAIPWYSIDQSEALISFSADFLETWVSNVQFARQFAELRAGEVLHPGWFGYFGPRRSLTASNADEFIQIPPGSEYGVALALLQTARDMGLWKVRGDEIADVLPRVEIDALPFSDARAKLEYMARIFYEIPGSAALAGSAASSGDYAKRLSAAAMLLNYTAGGMGRTVSFSRAHALGESGSDAELQSVLKGVGPKDVLILHRADIVHTRPWTRQAIEQAGLVVVLDEMPTDTATVADWVLPLDNPLESWGEYTAWSGLDSLVQATMERFLDTRPAGDIFLSLAEAGGKSLVDGGEGQAPVDYFTLLKKQWLEKGAGFSRGPEAFWREAKQNGGAFADPPFEEPKELLIDKDLFAAPAEALKPPVAGEARLWVYPSIFFFDGRTANRGWLQENPHPDSFTAWGSVVDVHPHKAEELGIEQGDILELATAAGTITAPVRVTDEVEPGVAAITLGLGHEGLGATAAGLGVNGFILLGPEADVYAQVVKLRPAGGTGRIISQTATTDQHGREIIQWIKLSELGKQDGAPPKIDLPLPESYEDPLSLYKGHEHAEHRWAMAIDLQRCIGCGACAVACYAENNISVVGADNTADKLDQPWLRVYPYQHPEDPTRVGWLPLGCQHCDAAPCEPVCPVFASVNNEEGLNAQVYNRCIGTRYCSQNCPYKVRKFNWYNHIWPERLKWQLNPEVSVRVRGVMEKCTFCIQRIQYAELKARMEQREIADGEIQPACVQSCPTRAFVFGDMLKEGSRINRIFRKDPRRYQVLRHLNTKPAVVYLKRVENDLLAFGKGPEIGGHLRPDHR